MDRKMLALGVFLALVACTSGCARVRTYVVEKERVDLNLSSGNAGYLAGTPKDSDIPKNRSLTRQTYVTEIELGSAPRRAPGSRGMAVQTAQEPGEEAPIEKLLPAETPAALANVTSYTVQNNDNLEKISQKVYGTSLKWKRIFEANKEKLHNNPNRIYAGQVLDIPRE